jgi:molybdate transport system ATP-binding protein
MIKARFLTQFADFSLEVSLDAPARGFHGLYGRSGSGKSTLLRCMTGLHPAKGYFEMRNTVWQDDAKGIYVPTHLRKIGFVSQAPFLFPHLNVRKNLEMGFGLLTEAEQTISFLEVIEQFELNRLLDRSIEALSGGEIQRVAIARTLLTSPKLLLLDEPLTGLDTESKEEIFPYLQKIQNHFQIPGFYVSHDIEEIRRLCVSVYRLASGKLSLSEPV